MGLQLGPRSLHLQNMFSLCAKYSVRAGLQVTYLWAQVSLFKTRGLHDEVSHGQLDTDVGGIYTSLHVGT